MYMPSRVLGTLSQGASTTFTVEERFQVRVGAGEELDGFDFETKSQFIVVRLGFLPVRRQLVLGLLFGLLAALSVRFEIHQFLLPTDEIRNLHSSRFDLLLRCHHLLRLARVCHDVSSRCGPKWPLFAGSVTILARLERIHH